MFELTISGRDGKTQRQEYFKSMSNAVTYAEYIMAHTFGETWQDVSDKIYSPDVTKYRLWRSDDGNRLRIEPINFRD